MTASRRSKQNELEKILYFSFVSIDWIRFFFLLFLFLYALFRCQSTEKKNSRNKTAKCNRIREWNNFSGVSNMRYFIYLSSFNQRNYGNRYLKSVAVDSIYFYIKKKQNWTKYRTIILLLGHHFYIYNK